MSVHPLHVQRVVWVLYSAKELAISLWRATDGLGNNLGCLGVSMGPFPLTAQLDEIVFRGWTLSLVEKR